MRSAPTSESAGGPDGPGHPPSATASEDLVLVQRYLCGPSDEGNGRGCGPERAAWDRFYADHAGLVRMVARARTVRGWTPDDLEQ